MLSTIFVNIDRTDAPMPPTTQRAQEPRQSALVSRNITVSGRRTSARLEPEMWTALYDICKRENMTIHQVCTLIDRARGPNLALTNAIKLFIMSYFRAAATEDGHDRASHGRGSPLSNTPFDPHRRRA